MMYNGRRIICEIVEGNSMTPSYIELYNDTNIVICVCSVDEVESIDHLQKHFDRAKEYIKQTYKTVIICNKYDLEKTKTEEEIKEELKNTMKTIDYIFVTSCVDCSIPRSLRSFLQSIPTLFQDNFSPQSPQKNGRRRTFSNNMSCYIV